MSRKSPGTYVLAIGVVVLVVGVVLLALPGPGGIVFGLGFVVTVAGVVLLLFERSRAKLAAMAPPDGGRPPAG